MKKESKPDFKCSKCGLVCGKLPNGDAESLKRHMLWNHSWETEGDKKP